MRIGLNLLHALPSIGGGWNYIARLIHTLGEFNRENEFVVFANQESESLIPRIHGFERVVTGVDSKHRAQRVLYENTWLQVMAAQNHLDCVHWFANTQALVNAVPGLVTVYDLQPFLTLARYSPMKRIYLQAMMRRTIRRAAQLLPISHSTATSLTENFGVENSRMTVIPPIIGREFMPSSRSAAVKLQQKYGLPDKFWLYVANFHAHKNHLALLEAYSLLKHNAAETWPVVFRGDEVTTKAEIVQALSRLSLQADVFFLPRLEERDLPALYTLATALVYPSLYEGGGIPVLEAMACGCPVIASDIPTTHEFADDSAYTFDPTNSQAIANAMNLFQSNDELRERFRCRGLARIGKYRPAEVYNNLIRSYELVVQRSKK